MSMLFALLVACAHPGAAPAPVAAADPAAPVPFTAHYEGAGLGLGLNCVVLDNPPQGAWTAVLRVVDPGDSRYTMGGTICMIVHSPALFRGEAVDEAGIAHCLAVRGAKPARFDCRPGQVPGPNTKVLDRAWADRLRPRAPATALGKLARPAPHADDLAGAVAALDEHAAALAKCPAAAAKATALAQAASKLGHTALDGDDPSANESVQQLVEVADGQVVAALRGCGE